MNETEKSLTSQQVAELLGVSAGYIQKLAEDGRLEGYKLGRDWRFTQESVTAYNKARRKVGRPRK